MNNPEIDLVDMRAKSSTKLRSLIEDACKKNKYVVSDEPLFICDLEDVSPREVLAEDKIYIANRKIFYCLGKSVVHEVAISILGNACLKAVAKATEKDCNFYPWPINVLNLYQCGIAHKKEPDFLLSIVDDFLMGPYPIIGEVAFSHESLNQLLYELINSISMYTEAHGIMGLKIEYHNSVFKMELLVLERSTEINNEKISLLNDYINSECLQTDQCIERPEIIKVGDINSENFGCEVIFELVITDGNIDKDVVIELNTKYITGEDGPMKIIIKSSALKHLKDKWVEHKKALSS